MKLKLQPVVVPQQKGTCNVGDLVKRIASRSGNSEIGTVILFFNGSVPAYQ